MTESARQHAADTARELAAIERRPRANGSRCPCTSPATARRCTLARYHETQHERRGRSGRLLEEWLRTPADV
ncbi:MAG: hypothetical protein LC750_16790, partial [Actinobacteria bacterium]|nr:hypothetical protein [Actinomycetota bacterium]